MKRGYLLMAIVLWILVAIAVVGLIFFVVNGGGFDKMTGTRIKDEKILLGNTQNIVVEGSSQTVEIRKTSDDSIKVSQYGNARSKKLFLVSSSDDRVHIYFDDKWHFNLFNFNINERLVVEIPEDFAGNLDVNTSSGGIRFKSAVAVKNLKAETSSGGIRSSMAINAEDEVVLKSSSGGIKISGAITTGALNAKTSSGGIRLGTVNVETYYLQSSSGGIKAEGISGGGEAETSSGGIEFSLKSPKGDIRLTSSSGGIKIGLESSLQFTLDAKTSSGGIHTNFATVKNDKGNRATAEIGDNPTVFIKADASSGGIRVEK